MKVIFIAYTDFRIVNSGSSVRPYKIYTAFKEKGYKVLLINGEVKERRSKFLEYKRRNMFRDVDYCYIEPSTYPTHPLDYLMLAYIKKLNIPIGIFYRDMYYKFPEFFKKSGFKKYELLFRYYLDWRLFKRISKVIFFPSNTMAGYFNFHNKVALPPAGEVKKLRSIKLNNNVIYVGGISERYGTPVLLEALKIVNNCYKRIGLNLVCREYEDKIFAKYKNEAWLNIINASGTQLEKIYAESDIAIIPRKRNEYFDFSVPVKLFEYMSYNLPIISTKCFETATFIKQNNIGIVVNDDAKSIAQAIIDVYENPYRIRELKDNIQNCLVSENLWVHRIDKIEQCLYGVR